MDVLHEPDRQRFVVTVTDLESVLEYRQPRPGTIEFTRTFVPESLRGRGIAERLVRTGLRWARAEADEVQASCWYVQRFLQRRDRHGK